MNGIINGVTSNQYIIAKIEWNSVPDENKNQSTVTAKLFYKRTNAGYTTSGKGNFSINIDGEITSTNGKFIEITERGWTLALSATKIISHNADGSKTLNITANGNIPNTSLSSTTLSGDITLETLIVASIPTIEPSVFNIGEPITLYTNRKRTSYTHTVSVTDKMGIVTVLGTGITESIVLQGETLNNILYDLATNDKFCNPVFTLTTFDGEIIIGENTVLAMANVPISETTRPDMVVKYEVNDIDVPESLKGIYIQNKAGIKADFDGSIAKKGASLIGGKSGASLFWQNGGAFSIGGVSWTFGSFEKAGTFDVTAKISDSRGIESLPYTESITVVPYGKPSIAPVSGSEVICKRIVEFDTTTQNTISYLYIKAKRQYSKVLSDNLQKNFCLFEYRLKPANAVVYDAWKTLLEKADTNDIFDGKIKDVIPDENTAYDVQIRVLDDMGETNVLTFNIPSVDVLIHLKNGGKGMGIGKKCEGEGLEVGFDVEFFKNFRYKGWILDDFIVERGNIGIWKYRKFRSGMAELWGKAEIDVNINQAWGTLFFQTIEAQAYPFTFKKIPYCVISAENTTIADNSIMIAYNAASTTSASQKLDLVRPTELTGKKFNLIYHVFGQYL